MAQEQGADQSKASWTKVFTAFKIALDMKKLVLAGAGIFCASVGWWAISLTFYSMRTAPNWEKDFGKAEQWAEFKARHASYNLIHELAGSPSDHRKVDAADVAKTHDEFLLLSDWSKKHQTYERSSVKLSGDELKVDGQTVKISPVDNQAKAELPNLEKAKLTIKSISFWEQKDGEKVNRGVLIEGVRFNVEGSIDKIKELREGAMDLADIEKAALADNRQVARDALAAFREHLARPKYKAAGRFRVLPWFEERGDNPYLIVARGIETRGESIFGGGKFFSWLFGDAAPVVLEPLYKFLAPIAYFFDSRAGALDRLYLVFIMVWTLVVWGFFGGAICRIAAMQVARNERITLKEAIAFTRERYVSYLAAPVFPMVLVGILTIVLIVFGWIEWIPLVGDLFAGLLWPIVILLGFIMAIVLVGLIGWPLMTATISTEGTDSFDALSRSYSYVYQATWQYIWYNFLAVVYGAVLVFFIGFMASLMVFLGKWGVSSAPGLAGAKADSDREPSYLAYYAPTSFGWRDLLIGSSRFTEQKKEITPDGREVTRLAFTSEYDQHMKWYNHAGAFLVAIWLWFLFLLIVGFGYSYFWTASTIVYFLMRNYVDDTEMDEVHQDDEELDEPLMRPTSAPPAAPPAPAPAPAASKAGTVSLNVVEAPPPSSYSAGEPPPSPAPPTPPENSTQPENT